MPMKCQSIGLSSTEELFSSEDPAELRRSSTLVQIVHSVALQMSQAESPREILEWIRFSIHKIWGKDRDIKVTICLQESEAPEGLSSPHSPRARRERAGLGTGSPEPPPAARELYSLDLSSVQWMLQGRDGRAEDDGGACCQWFGGNSFTTAAEWERLELAQHPALRLCFEGARRIFDTQCPHGRNSPDREEEAGSGASRLYVPLSIQDECLGVLRLVSASAHAFTAIEQEIFGWIIEVAAVHLKALHKCYEADCCRRAAKKDRRRQQEMAAAYRELLNDMLPPNVVDELRMSRSSGSTRSTCSLREVGPRELRVSAPRARDEGAQQVSLTLLESIGKSPSSFRSNVTAQLDRLRYAEYHECVAILFADIKDFTRLNEEFDPAEVMLMLNDLFGRFDCIVEDHAPAAYKVETIGDSYMLAFGLNGQTRFAADLPMDYSVAVHAIILGAEMIRASRGVLTPSRSGAGRPIGIRVGVHVGRIMSGIIGKRVRRYCVFGDTVNTASRMQSMGVPGKIQVTECVQKACMQGRQGRKLAFHSTGGRKVKGKGRMKTFLLDPEEVINAAIRPQLNCLTRTQIRASKGNQTDPEMNPSCWSAQDWGAEKSCSPKLGLLALIAKALCRVRCSSHGNPGCLGGAFGGYFPRALHSRPAGRRLLRV